MRQQQQQQQKQQQQQQQQQQKQQHLLEVALEVLQYTWQPQSALSVSECVRDDRTMPDRTR